MRLRMNLERSLSASPMIWSMSGSQCLGNHTVTRIAFLLGRRLRFILGKCNIE